MIELSAAVPILFVVNTFTALVVNESDLYVLEMNCTAPCDCPIAEVEAEKLASGIAVVKLTV
jgi:hypothetical protein